MISPIDASTDIDPSRRVRVLSSNQFSFRVEIYVTDEDEAHDGVEQSRRWMRHSLTPRATERTNDRTSDRVEMFAAARRRGSRGWTKCVAVFAIGALFASANYGVTKGTTRRDAPSFLKSSIIARSSRSPRLTRERLVYLRRARSVRRERRGGCRDRRRCRPGV